MGELVSWIAASDFLCNKSTAKCCRPFTVIAVEQSHWNLALRRRYHVMDGPATYRAEDFPSLKGSVSCEKQRSPRDF